MADSDTKRQKIVDAVIARMGLIRVANGYQTEIGARVEDWPQRFDERELKEQPSKAVLGVYDLPDAVSKESLHSTGATHRLRMQVRIFITGATPARELRKMIGDVVAAVGKDLTWGYLARDTEPGSEGFVVPNDAMEVAGAAVEFIVVYNTATFDPYQ
jgi:hypothetical protein